MISFKPIPFKEAQRQIEAKGVLEAEVFKRLLPELKARAFTISLVNGPLEVMRRARDLVAEMAAGRDWDEVKREIADELSPFLGEADEAEARAEILLRTHGYQALERANHEVIMANTDVFPYCQYITAGDENVRPAHAALDGLILPTDDPFWETHTPPWDWGCRCTKIGLTSATVDKVREQEKGLAPEARTIIEGPQLHNLTNSGTLHRSVDGAPARNFDVRAPIEKAATPEERRAAFGWNPNSLAIPLDQLKARYTVGGLVSPEWELFERLAKAEPFDDTRSVWDWLEGKAETKTVHMGEPMPWNRGRTSPTPGGDAEPAPATQADKMLRKFEAKYVGGQVEHALSVTPEGKVIGKVSGSGSEVRVPVQPGCKVTHTHTHEGPPSIDKDVFALLEGDIGVSRIATQDYVYIFERPAGGWMPAGSDPKDFHEQFKTEFRNQTTQAFEKLARERNLEAPAEWQRVLDDAEHMAYDAVAKQFGWGYRRYRRP